MTLEASGEASSKYKEPQWSISLGMVQLQIIYDLNMKGEKLRIT